MFPYRDALGCGDGVWRDDMKERKMLSLSGFKGVDLSSAPTMVHQNRASYSVNMINDNGINHKRPGWEEQLKLGGRINGMYHYKNGEHEVVLVYAGTKFYEIKSGVASELFVVGEYNLTDDRVQFFRHGERVYVIGCGAFLVYEKEGTEYKMRTVASSPNTYIPTTTVYGDVEKSGDGSHQGEWISYGNRSVIDSPNMLTAFRKNKFVGVKPESGSVSYYTDARFLANAIKSIEVEFYSEYGAVYTKYYTVGDKVGLIKSGDLCLGISTAEDWSFSGEDEVNNVTITFEAYYEDSSRIECVNKCRFGTVFGAFGNSDRLFLSGNPSMPNADFYSGHDDFTYFAEGGQTVMGSDDVPITGYMRLSDSVLATFKRSNTTEPTIYYRSATERENSEGYTDIEFTRWAGGINEGCVNPHTVVNLAGDDMFVSPNGVYGVVQVQNTSKNDRYIRQRDVFINTELRDRDMTDAVSFVYGNRYYLSLGNGECYVADPRYKNYLSEDIDGSFNYEWWKWTNVPARVFVDVDGELWFGDSEGRICRFDDKFCDRTHDISDRGTVTVSRDTITYDASLAVSVGDRVKLIPESPTSIFCKYLSADEYEVMNGAIKCSEEMIDRVYLAQELYADNVGGSGLGVNKKYVVFEVDRGECLFRLKDENGVEVKIVSGGFALHRVISQKDLIVAEVNDGTLKVSDNYGVLDITAYNYGSNIITRLEFTHTNNICSEWYTPVFDLGASHLHKTLLRLNITIDPNVRGALKVGYETNDKLAYIGASAGKVFSFDEFSFNDFSFTTGFTVTHSQKVKARNFNYIMFRFVSDNDADCAVDSFSAEYIYNGGRFAGMR